jgi:hypothetical protein
MRSLAAQNARRTLLLAVFDLVTGEDWKAPVFAYVPATKTVDGVPVTPALLAEAVAFFTATEATLTPVTGMDGTLSGHVVTAAGYRAGPAH